MEYKTNCEKINETTTTTSKSIKIKNKKKKKGYSSTTKTGGNSSGGSSGGDAQRRRKIVQEAIVSETPIGIDEYTANIKPKTLSVPATAPTYSADFTFDNVRPISQAIFSPMSMRDKSATIASPTTLIPNTANTLINKAPTGATTKEIKIEIKIR